MNKTEQQEAACRRDLPAQRPPLRSETLRSSWLHWSSPASDSRRETLMVDQLPYLACGCCIPVCCLGDFLFGRMLTQERGECFKAFAAADRERFGRTRTLENIYAAAGQLERLGLDGDHAFAARAQPSALGRRRARYRPPQLHVHRKFQLLSTAQLHV